MWTLHSQHFQMGKSLKTEQMDQYVQIIIKTIPIRVIFILMGVKIANVNHNTAMNQ